MAPESLYNTIQETFRQHFCQPGHFVFVTKMVEDVTNEERQNALIIKEHQRAHRGTTEVENQLRRAFFFPRMGNKIRIHINACNICNKHKYDRKPYNIKISLRPITTKLLERLILTLTEILKIKDLLVNQGINVTLPDEALQYVTPKIAINKDTLLYILQVPKMEEEDSVILTIIPLVVNNTIIPDYPRHLIKSKQKVFTTLNHNTFVQKHSDIKEFRDSCIRPLVMGARSQCNVTSETQTTVQYIAEDKLLLINAKNETLYSNCGPNNRELTGNFLVDFFNCTLTFRDKKFHSYEVETEMQVVQGAMHNVQATRQLIASLSVDVLNQENIENRKRLTHVYLRQADHQNWMLTLSGGISVSSIGIIILIVYIRIAHRSSTININDSSKTSSPTSTTLPSTSYSDVLSKYGILPKAEDALSPPPGGVTCAR